MSRFQAFAYAALVSSLVAGCGKPAETPEAPRPVIEGERIAFPAGSPQLASLTTEPVRRIASAPLRLTGRLIWDEDATVRLFSPFGGRVAKIMAQPGDRVQAGQALAQLASPDFGQAQADAGRAAADSALARQTVERMKELHQHGVAAQKDLQAAEAEQARTAGELQRTRERLKLYGGSGNAIDQAYLLRSPIAGNVVEKNINPGQELRPDQMLANLPALFVVTDPSRLWVQLDANERDLPHLARGGVVRVISPAYPGTVFEGKITSVADFIDPSTRTVKVRGTVPNAERKLKGEMYVTAELAGPESFQLTIPARAVYLQGERQYVFLDEGEGRYARAEIGAGSEHDGQLVVVSGLKEGQRVVAEGVLLLQSMLLPRRVVK